MLHRALDDSGIIVHEPPPWLPVDHFGRASCGVAPPPPPAQPLDRRPRFSHYSAFPRADPANMPVVADEPPPEAAADAAEADAEDPTATSATAGKPRAGALAKMMARPKAKSSPTDAPAAELPSEPDSPKLERGEERRIAHLPSEQRQEEMLIAQTELCPEDLIQMRCDCGVNPLTHEPTQNMSMRCARARHNDANSGPSPWLPCHSGTIERNTKNFATCTLRAPPKKGPLDTDPEPPPLPEEATKTIAYGVETASLSMVIDRCRPCFLKKDYKWLEEKANMNVKARHAERAANGASFDVTHGTLNVVNCPNEQVEVKCECKRKPLLDKADAKPRERGSGMNALTEAQELSVRCTDPKPDAKPPKEGERVYSETRWFPCLPVEHAKTRKPGATSRIDRRGGTLDTPEVACLFPFGTPQLSMLVILILVHGLK